MNIVGESKMGCFGHFDKDSTKCCIHCNVATECYEQTLEDVMTNQQVLDRLWTLKNAVYDPDYTQKKIVELLLNYAPKDVQEAVGRIYSDDIVCTIKDCSLYDKGNCRFKKGFSVINILNCPRGYGKRRK